MRVSFSVAHTGGLALYAVARDIQVGIDVERIDPARASLLVADAFMSAAESTHLRTCRDDVRAREFFRLWTRREALLKARGTGWFDESSATDAEEGDSVGLVVVRADLLDRLMPLQSQAKGSACRVLLFDLSPRYEKARRTRRAA